MDEYSEAVNSQGSRGGALVVKNKGSSKGRDYDGILSRGEMNRNEFAALVMSPKRDEASRQQNRGEKDLFREST